MGKNQFLKAFNYGGLTFTENGALSHASTGSELANQFGKAGNYRGRDIEDVFEDMENLWNEDALNAMRFIFYLRTITRKTRINDKRSTDKVQKGQGVRDEFFKRILWVAKNHYDTFEKNIWLIPIVGSWKDLWMLLYYDRLFEVFAIDETVIFNVINGGLLTDTHTDLVKKYMPRIKTRSKCTTRWTKLTNGFAMDYANYVGLKYKEYNHLKTSGTAHDFQKIICGRRFDEIDWKKIPGKALSTLVNGKFLTNHNLMETYTDWVMAQPTVKYTGYVCDLFHDMCKGNAYYESTRSTLPLFKKLTLDRQFDELVKKAEADGKIKGNVWCALDTSGSMISPVAGGKYTAYDVCASLGIFFSTLNKGAFHKNVAMFDHKTTTLQLDGTFTDMAEQILTAKTAWGNTNFMSLVDEFVHIRQTRPDIPLEDYPQTIIVVSDMQFDIPSNHTKTNYEEMKEKLYDVFPKDFVDSMRFIWWDCTSRGSDFPSTIDDAGTFFLSGFDGSIISLLLGEEVKNDDGSTKCIATMEEMVEAALGQEILSYVEVD